MVVVGTNPMSHVYETDLVVDSSSHKKEEEEGTGLSIDHDYMLKYQQSFEQFVSTSYFVIFSYYIIN